MILHRRAARAWLVGVGTDGAQVAWRGLGTGELQLRCLEDDVEATVTVPLTRAGAAGAVHLDGLPAGRLLRLEVRAPGLPAERSTLLARTLAAPPGDELVRFATVSDLHLGTEVFGQRGTLTDPVDHPDPHPLRCAEAAWDEATAWGASRIVAKGDLTNLGRPHEWRTFAGLVARGGVPVDAIPGNHDHARPGAHGALLPGEAARTWGLSMAQPLLVRDLPGVRLLLADTTVPSRHAGTLAHVADDLLDAAAEADHQGGVIVVLHHQLQPHPVAEGWPPGIPRHESLAFLDRLGAAHPHAMVTSGHTHRHRRWGRAGVVVTQVGSTKDYPGVWAGYAVHEGGIVQTVRRIERPDCIEWTDHSRLAAFGAWEHASPGRLDARCFTVAWSQPTAGPAHRSGSTS